MFQVWGGGFPCVFKIGHAHGGLGKVKVENEAALEVCIFLYVYFKPEFETRIFI